jgi:hypothetical protein
MHAQRGACMECLCTPKALSRVYLAAYTRGNSHTKGLIEPMVGPLARRCAVKMDQKRAGQVHAELQLACDERCVHDVGASCTCFKADEEPAGMLGGQRAAACLEDYIRGVVAVCVCEEPHQEGLDVLRVR